MEAGFDGCIQKPIDPDTFVQGMRTHPGVDPFADTERGRREEMMERKILIADDNGNDRYLLKCLLEGEGLEVAVSQNGKEALEKAHADPPDLVISDILMPVMDGYALCREWKKDDQLKRIPFVIYTATYAGSKHEKFASDIGVDRFVLKPQETDALMDILRELLEDDYVVREAAVKPLNEGLQFFKQYNEILFEKLEKKMQDLETTNQNLRLLEERLQLIFENISDVVCMIDADLKMVSLSPSVERIFGYEPQDFVGRSLSDLDPFFAPESLKQAIANAIQILKGHTIEKPVYQLLARDGTVKYVEVNGSPVMSEDKIIGIIAVARDITERKRAEEALAESEKKFRFITEKMTDVVWTQDMNLRTVYVSPSVKAMLGFTPEERRAQEVHEQLTPESMSVALDVMAKELALEQQGQADPERKIILELEYYHKDGSTRWLENIISGIRDDRGALIGLHGVSRDVTQRKKAEKALGESERKYKKLVDFLPVSLFEVDLSGNVTSANPAIFETFGYTQTDFEEGLNGFRMIIPDDQERLARNIQRLLNGEWKGPSEYTGIRKDGSTFPILIFPGVIIREGRPVGLRGALIDLTDRKLMEESLRKSNLSLAEAQRIAHIGSWEWDIENDDMYWSDEIYRILGTTPQLFDGTYEAFLGFVFPEERDLVRKAVEKTLHGGVKSEMEHHINRSDGSVREVGQRLEPLMDHTGKIVRVFGIVQDITERNQMERELENARNQLLQAEKLASLGRLSAGVAHEILNPVNIISMELQLLTAKGNLPPDVLEELKTCMVQIERIVGITKDLKQLSRFPSHQQTVTADINEIIAHILNVYATQLKIEKIETEVQCRPDLPMISMDKGKIEQVILNLVTNAVDAMEGKEKKVLRIRTELEKTPGGPDSVKITIADNGTGISRKQLSKIYDPFFTTKESGKGTGLGLSISYGIVQDHGGMIWAANNEWGGASFYVRLPVKTDV